MTIDPSFTDFFTDTPGTPINLKTELHNRLIAPSYPLSIDFGRGLRDGDNGAPDAAHSADDGQRLRGQCEI